VQCAILIEMAGTKSDHRSVKLTKMLFGRAATSTETICRRLVGDRARQSETPSCIEQLLATGSSGGAWRNTLLCYLGVDHNFVGRMAGAVVRSQMRD
jgi:hypothetical protein